MVAKRIVWAFCLALAAPSLAHALGLGDIRLSSALNQPLEAEIELLNAAPEELAELNATLASRETFARYGLDYPNFLNSVSLTRGKSASGRDVLKVRSAETITEPFVSLLVEVNWGRGRLVREYTVLLDPPVYAPNTPPVAAAAPPTTASATSGSIVRPAAEPAPAAETQAPAPESVDTYTVRRGDSLSSIAGRLAGSVGTGVDPLMVGLYRSNPEAFEGNMNALRAGAILRIPESSTLQAIARSDASAEIQRQYASWRGGASGGSGSGSGRLRLVAPGEPGASGGATADEVRGLRDRLSQLEGELAESKRLLELRNAELATLQQQLAARGGTPAPVAEPAPAPSPAPAAQGEAPVAAVTPDPGAAAEPAATEPAPVAAAPEPDQPMRTRVQEEPAADTGPSIIDTIQGVVRDYWYVLAGLVALVLGFLGLRKFQERRAAQDTLAATGGFASSESLSSPAPVEVSRRNDAPPGRGDMLVEESGENEQPSFARNFKDSPSSRAPATSGGAMVEGEPSVTLSGDTAVNLDQGDPLAEADFHMAYGLYDQAADLVRGAIQREPTRLDLKLKLVEVFFVWGNKDEFLRQAREIHQSGLAAGTGDWDKIVIMGRQIAPEEALFTQGDGGSLTKGGVDLDLAGGDSRVDLDLSAEPSADSIDLDLGSSLAAAGGGGGMLATPDTVSMPMDLGSADQTQRVGEMTISLDGELNTGGTTRQMAPDITSTAAIDLDFGAAPVGSESPTVEQPALRDAASPTIREKLDAAKRMSPESEDDAVERTSEVAIDDLGLDIADIEGLDLPDDPTETSSDSPTLVSGLDEDSRRIMAEAAARREQGATATLASLDGADAPDLDFDLGDVGNDKTVENPAIRANGAADKTVNLGFNLGESNSSGETLIADDVALPPLEPVTMSEVGTKLDLARAYVDMGDPDGARNILQEVLQEGSLSQKQEAQRLLDAIPG